MSKERSSNLELMRIISMLFIVLGHVFLFGKLLEVENKHLLLIYYFFEFILIVHVNSYVLVTGYFQSNSTFKVKKIWDIISSSWFYRVVIMLIFLLLGITSIGKEQIIKDLLPITIDNYWFIKVYIVLYLFSPFINKLIHHLKKEEFKKLVLLGFIIFCITPYITNSMFFENSGYTLYNFIYLYFLGAYLKKYPLEKNKFFKKIGHKNYRNLMFIIFFTCVILNFLLFYIAKYIFSTDNSITNYLCQIILNNSIAYSNPIIMIQTVAYFQIFLTFKFSSKIVNKISSLTLGVYFIHENNYVRDKLYKWLGIIGGNHNSFKFIGYTILIAILIFIVCSFIEFIRQELFKGISNTKIVKVTKKYTKNKLKNVKQSFI